MTQKQLEDYLWGAANILRGNLSLQLYVKQLAKDNEHNTQYLIAEVKNRQIQINTSMENLFTQLKNIGIEV